MSQKKVGSRAEVWHGVAHHLKSGLTKKDLMKNKHGRIVSRRKHTAGKKAIKNLFALGFKPTKGRFSLMSKSSRKSVRKSRKARK